MTVMGRALVVGGNGFLGSNLVRGLQGEGFAVRVLDRTTESALPRDERSVELVVGDFGNREVTARALDAVDIVFHLASATLPASGTDNPVHDVSENLLGTLRLVEQCLLHGVRRLVFISSGGTVYGRARQIPIPEDHPLEPINSYAIVKLAIEKYLMMYRHLGRLDAIVLRAANAYGPGQSTRGVQGAIGVAFGCIQRNEAFRLWGDGTVVRDYVYVDDLTAAFIASIRTPAPAPAVFNIGSGLGVSLTDVLAACERVAGRPLKIERLPGRAIDVPSNVLDCRFAREHLGWVPRVSLEEGLRRTWAWLSTQAS